LGSTSNNKTPFVVINRFPDFLASENSNVCLHVVPFLLFYMMILYQKAKMPQGENEV